LSGKVERPSSRIAFIVVFPRIFPTTNAMLLIPTIYLCFRTDLTRSGSLFLSSKKPPYSYHSPSDFPFNNKLNPKKINKTSVNSYTGQIDLLKRVLFYHSCLHDFQNRL
jgi:hypothetical protein